MKKTNFWDKKYVLIFLQLFSKQIYKFKKNNILLYSFIFITKNIIAFNQERNHNLNAVLADQSLNLTKNDTQNISTANYN